MRFSHFSLLFLSLLLSACSTPSKEDKIVAAPVIRGNFTKVLEVNYRGTFVNSDKETYFKACGSDIKLPVKANFSLRNIYQQLTSTSGKAAYIEFTGEIIFPHEKEEGVDAEMRIDRVHHMSIAKSSLKCAKNNDSFHFKANGETPYWRLSIDGSNLFFANQFDNKEYSVQKTDFRTTQINEVMATSKKGKQIKLTIKPGHCYVTEKKEYWGYTAQVDTTSGLQFTGCGEPGWPSIEEPFEGFYLNSNDSAITNLILNKNHTVEYEQAILGQTTTKTGFWKSNNPGSVVIMLTKEGDSIIEEELNFSRRGLSLTANSINRNNVITAFSAPGFVFNKMNMKNGMLTNNDGSKYDPLLFTPQDLNPTSELDKKVQKAVQQYFKIHRTDPKQTKFNAVLYDINNDGFQDAFVFLDWCSSSACEMIIFEGGKSGYTFSSRISRMPAPVTLSNKHHYLWQSLLITKNKKYYTLDFDGMSYPIHTRSLQEINKALFATDVVLFSDGLPEHWFLIEE